MHPYQHKSGSLKRKEKAARDANTQKGQTSITRFIAPPGTASSSSTASSEQKTTDVSPSPDSSGDGGPGFTGAREGEDDYEMDTENDSGRSAQESDAGLQPTSDYPRKSTGTLPVPDTPSDEGLPRTLNDFDIGDIEKSRPSNADVAEAVRRGHRDIPSRLPEDETGRAFPVSVLSTELPNGEKVRRDWLVWSPKKKALYCFCCRLFYDGAAQNRSSLASSSGVQGSWPKLYEKIPTHQKSPVHMHCYVKWKKLEKDLSKNETIDMLLHDNLLSETKKWKLILRRLLDVTLFLAERALPFRGSTEKIGDPSNGLFLGTCELLAHYDPVMAEHLRVVKEAQSSGQRLQVTYLSHDIQEEFIERCATYVREIVLQEIKAAKYYSILVDATQDLARIEQNIIVLRYLHLNGNKYEPRERFIDFVDSHDKTGEGTALMIKDALATHALSLSDCRGQGYDNAANMTGPVKGTSTRLLEENPLAKLCPCGAHSLNLCGNYAVKCCPEVVTFFGVVQSIYTLFGGSAGRWALLKGIIHESLHPLSDTRWSAQMRSVRPFAAHNAGLRKALEELKANFHLTPEAKAEVNGALKYLSSFKCILLSSIWFKALTAIDYRSQILQRRTATLDVEVQSLDGLLADLSDLKTKWDEILNECKEVAKASGIIGQSGGVDEKEEMWPRKRKRKPKKFFDESDTDSEEQEEENNREEGNSSEDFCEEAEEFKAEVFDVIFDKLTEEIQKRYELVREIDGSFGFLWRYLSLSIDDVRAQAAAFCEEYSVDVSKDLVEEVLHLRAIHRENFGQDALPPLELLNAIQKENLSELFPNICVALRIFCCLPVSTASCERGFSFEGRVKNPLRSTMSQKRLSSLGMLGLNVDLARTIDFDAVINDFAAAKARKCTL